MDKYLVIHIRKNSLTPSIVVTWNLDKLVEMYSFSSKKAKDVYLIYRRWDTTGDYQRIRTIVEGVISCDNSDYVDIERLFRLR